MVKRFKNLFESVYSEENLFKAYRKARKGKGKKYYVINFEKNLHFELSKLKSELKTGNYAPRPLNRFVIHDPKTRVIHAPDFRDRVVHHAINNILEPIFDRTFIYDSYASRKRKGTHAALQRFDAFKKKVSRNGMLVPSAVDNNMACGFVLKADIKHYFPSVNHAILICLIERKLSDKKLLTLLKKIIVEYATEKGRGMPLGALTSQMFANIYLNPLDHFVKERLSAKFYLRYLDDFVILHRSRKQLIEWKSEINTFLVSKLALELHNEKTSIFPMHRGVTLLGFRCFYYFRLPKKYSAGHFLKRLRKSDKNKAQKIAEGWFAHISWGNTYKLRKKIKTELIETI